MFENAFFVKKVLPGGCLKRSHNDWKQRLSSLTGFFVTTINFLLGTFQLRSTVCKQLSSPKMEETYFLLIEWDTRIELLQ